MANRFTNASALRFALRRPTGCHSSTVANYQAVDPSSDKVSEIGCVRGNAAAVPGFENFGLLIGGQGSKNPSSFSPVPGGQVPKRLVVTKGVRVNSGQAFLGGFLLGQHLTGEQGQSLSLAGQSTLRCRQTPRRDASGRHVMWRQRPERCLCPPNHLRRCLPEGPDLWSKVHGSLARWHGSLAP